MENDTIKLELKVNEANLVLNALAELPFKISNDLIMKIQSQASTKPQSKVPELNMDDVKVKTVETK